MTKLTIMNSPDKFKVLSFCIFVLFSVQITAQEKNWTPVNYGPKQYGRNYEATNLSLVQDKRGVMYFGNANGILEFDGFFWNFIPVKQGLWINSLANGDNGEIFIGSQNEFGFLRSDSAGRFRYFSLSDSIKDKVFPFSTIWKIYNCNKISYFQCDEYIFRYNGKTTDVIEARTSFHTSFLVNGKYYIRQRGSGLMELQKNELFLIKGGEKFKETGIFSISPIPDRKDEYIIATQEDGLWLMDNNGISEFKEPINRLISSLNLKVLGCNFISGRELVLNTSNEGIIIANIDGQLLDHICHSNGLSDDNVNNLLLDSEKNIWATTQNGISRIDNNSSFSFFSQKEGITGSINSIIRYGKILYLGTSDQLLAGNNDTKRFTGNEFIPVPGMEKWIWAFADCSGKLVAAANDGLYQINQGRADKISDRSARCLVYSPKNKLLLAGGNKGLCIYSINGWKMLKNIADNIDVTGIAIDTSEINKTIIWLGSFQQGLTEISLTNDLKIKITQYTEKDGLNNGLVWPFAWNNKILFLSNQIVFSHVSEEEIMKGLPDSVKNNEKYNRGYFDAFPFPYKKPIYFFTESKDRTWITNGNQVGYIMKNDSNFVSKPFNGIDFGKINCFYPEISGINWIGANEGLIRYDFLSKAYNDSIFSCIIRNVSFAKDSVMYYGGPVIPVSPSLKFSSNDARIEFSSTNYYNGDKTQFSYYLDGYMNNWSDWIPDHYANFINLREGEYTFKVRAKNVYGTESKPAEYKFRILAPWYRSWIAFMFYAAMVILLIWLIIKLYTYRLKQKNRQLEAIVRERTREIQLQKDKIEEQNVDLEKRNIEIMAQKADITDSINYARQIQTALLPDPWITKEYVDDIFVLYKPRDIVSGDFYWFSEVNNFLVVVAADCTGHGVPGAFMSMLGMSFLNSIVNEKNIIDPGEVLNNLRDYVISSLHQRVDDSHPKDGMDICICLIDKANMAVHYSGAYNSLIQVDGEILTEYRTDRMPVAVFLTDQNFTTKQIKVKKGDLLYLFSDGYHDQFGGQQNIKFMKKNFKDKLLEISRQPMEQQRLALDATIEEYKGTNFQTDDILVIGLKI
jgi:serine phosphatase RsbU (regulator of sigma subunit)